MDTTTKLLTLLDASKQRDWTNIRWEPTAHGARMMYRKGGGRCPVPPDLRKTIGLYDLSSSEARQFEQNVRDELGLGPGDRRVGRTITQGAVDYELTATAKRKIVIPTNAWRPLFVFHDMRIPAPTV